jgi:hypothetical protein
MTFPPENGDLTKLINAKPENERNAKLAEFEV